MKKMNRFVLVFVSGMLMSGFMSCPTTGTGTQDAESNKGAQAGKTGQSARINGNRVKGLRDLSERDDPSKTEEERIAAAIAWGDGAYLYAYTQKADADPKLTAQAKAGMNRYSGMDSGMGKYLNDKMEAQVRKVPQDLTEKVFADPAAALPDVVSSLLAGVSDQSLKAKILHDWICDNIAYDAEMFFSGGIADQDYESVLKKKLAVCAGYTNLYNQMCSLAGIESMGISGYSKGYGYSGKISEDVNHAWNAVKIGDRWYLVDVTWDAGGLERRTFIKRYSTGWLFVDPRPFLYSHLPEEEAYQFYGPALTKEDFVREANITGKFFQYRLLLKTEKPEYNNPVANGGFTFDLTLRNPQVSVSSMVRTPQQRDIEAASWTERNGGTITVTFDLPDTSDYKGHIFAKWQNDNPISSRINSGAFEQMWLPGAEKLLADKKITERELGFFKDSYFKVAENNYYYFREDQFDTPRNNGALKVHTLLGLITEMEGVLDFNLKASSGYQGFGSGVLKYPFAFPDYHEVSNTQLVSPMTGTLKAGSTQTFTVSTKDFSNIAIVVNGAFTQLVKNRAGNFEAAFKIPAGIDSLTLYGSGNGRDYTGLIRYTIIP